MQNTESQTCEQISFKVGDQICEILRTEDETQHLLAEVFIEEPRFGRGVCYANIHLGGAKISTDKENLCAFCAEGTPNPDHLSVAYLAQPELMEKFPEIVKKERAEMNYSNEWWDDVTKRVWLQNE